MLLSLAVWALAADLPRAYVVGLHVSGQVGDGPAEAAEALAKAIDESDKLNGFTPDETSGVIKGLEALILDAYAMGPGKSQLQKGRLLYEGAQPDKAIVELDNAVAQLAAGLAVSTDVRSLHEALMLLGVSYVGMGDEANAKAAFRRSAMLDPARELDAVNYPPAVVSLFNEVRTALTSESPAKVSISASTDAEVFIDGKLRGEVNDTPITVVPGTHYVLVRSASGASHFETVALRPGGSATVDALLTQRAVGLAEDGNAARSRQTRDLYKAVGQYATGGLVVLGGEIGGGQVALQLYSPTSGNFSKVLSAQGGDEPVTALLDLVPALVAFVGDTGDIRADKVSAQVCALDVGTNDVLAGMLYDPPEGQGPAVARSGPKWWVWAGIGAAVAGGGAAATAIALTSGGEEPGGTVTFGPIP